MHVSSVRPQTKFAAALVAAGVVSAATIVGVPENRGIAAIDADVANASVITDLLYNLGDAVNGVAAGLTVALDGALSLPFDAATAIALAAQNPSLSTNLLSWLVQRYVNPSASYLPYTYAWDIRAYSIEPLAELLPYPLGANIITAVGQISDAIGDALANLPSSQPGVDATNAFWASDIGRTLVAVNLAVTAPVWMAYNTVYYLGYLPADVEATLEAAIGNPGDIPGLVSNLVYGLLSPSNGLLGELLENASRPFTTLPGPIGDVVANLVTAISDGVDNLLSLLPAPISPHQNLLGSRTASEFVDTSVEVASLPEASLAVAGGITVSSVDPLEKGLDTTDSTVQTLQDGPVSSPPATPQDLTPAVGIDPTPAADPDAPVVTADKPLTNIVRSGNKVSPGDKFSTPVKGTPANGEPLEGEAVEGEPVAGEPVAGSGAPVSNPGAVDPAGAPAGPTGPQGGPTGAGEPSPNNEAGAAA